MNIKDETKKLQQNRLLRTSSEVYNFEQAIENILSLKDVNLIKNLCKGFDDQTSDHEVMFGLVHAVESFEGEEGLLVMAEAIPDMLPKAKEWVQTLHYRILNHEPSRHMYAKVLTNVNLNVKNLIIGILEEIKNEDPNSFENAVNELLLETR